LLLPNARAPIGWGSVGQLTKRRSEGCLGSIWSAAGRERFRSPLTWQQHD